MNNRISACFEQLQKQTQGRNKALIPYIAAGDPYAQTNTGADITVDLMHTLVRAGADILELGIPFSDPMADGPTIQRASERALTKGIHLATILNMVHTFRQTDTGTPIVLMGYANPIAQYDAQHGQGSFADNASAAGVDGVLVVDYPPEEAGEFAQQLKQNNIAPIFLLAPTSTPNRIQLVGKLACGYVYYVSLKGVTGAANLDVTSVSGFMPQLRKEVHIPVCVGFGIRDAASAQAVSKLCDGVIVGSRLIELLEKLPHEQVLNTAHQFIKELREALDT